MDDSELEALRQRRLAEMQQSGHNQAEAQERARQMEIQKQSVLRQILTPEARDRLANIKIANPEMANMVEMQLIQIAQSGRLGGMISDAMLRDILMKIAPQRREITIERR
ncbi:MAG: DNA-binding protein [Methanomassiliicoccaceae archaeon]|nr:DNA-binding protein [Methanomassiliicoccaceae archaeon]